MELPDVVEVQVGSSSSCNSSQCLAEMGPFAYGVNNHYNSIVSTRFRELEMKSMLIVF